METEIVYHSLTSSFHGVSLLRMRIYRQNFPFSVNIVLFCQNVCGGGGGVGVGVFCGCFVVVVIVFVFVFVWVFLNYYNLFIFGNVRNTI